MQSVEYKKMVLMKHLPLLAKMVSKVKGTKFETKWRNTLNLIQSDKELTGDQIKQLDEKLSSFAETYYVPKPVKETTTVEQQSNEIDKSLTSNSKVSKECLSKEEGNSVIQSPRGRSLSPAKPKTKPREQTSTSQPETTDLKELLSSIKMSDDDPDQALQAIEQILGSENLLKLQNLLLKGIIKKNISGSVSSPAKKKDDATEKVIEDIPSSSTPTTSTQKRPPKRKLNELEKLQQDISEMYDRDLVYKTSQQTSRACAKKTGERMSEIFEREKESDTNILALTSKDEKILMNIRLKDLYIVAEKLNISRKDMPIKVTEDMNENYINQHIQELKMKPAGSQDRVKTSENAKKIKLEQHELTTGYPATIRSVAKKRITNNQEQPEDISHKSQSVKKRPRNGWSKGFIKKTKKRQTNKEREGEWEDVDKKKRNEHCETEINLEKFSEIMQRDTLEDGIDESADSTIDENTTIHEARSVEKASCNNTVDESELLEEIPTLSQNSLCEDSEVQTPEKSPMPIIPVKVEKIANVPALINAIPESKLMPSSSQVVNDSKISSPPTKLIKLAISNTPKAIIKPLQSTDDEMRMFEFKKIKIPPNPTHADLIRIDPKPKTTVAPLMINIKNLSTLKVLPSTQTPSIVTKTSSTAPTSNNAPNASSYAPRFSLPLPESIPKTLHSSETTPSIASLGKVMLSIAPPRRDSMTSKPYTIASTSKTQSTIIQPSPSSLIEPTKPFKAIVLPPHLGGNRAPVILPTKTQENQALCDREDILRPWIEDPTLKCTKAKTTCVKMINKYCLAALYKCMGSTCCFYTNDKHLFQIHVELHLKLQTMDFRNCLVCAYCQYLGPSIVGLIKHIESEHRFDLYSCNQCFYRSLNEYQMYLNHYPKYHKEMERVAIQLDGFIKKPAKSDLLFIKNTLGSNIAAFNCIFPGCGKRFYVLEVFNEHLQNHEEKVSTKCLRCKQKTTPENIFEHYFSCYGFGMIQCVYCSFGTTTMQLIDDHLSTCHPSRSPYFAERMLSTAVKSNPTISLSSIETLTIKLMSKKVDGGLKVLVQDKELLNNAINIGNLSDETEIVDHNHQVAPSSLQIESVVSLNTQSIN